MTDAAPARPPSRIALIDAMRGVALVAMAIYHFAWDLEFFGYATPGMTAEGGWKLFARCIASSFLLLVGVSLVLAHRNGVRWPAFWRRWLMVAGAAALITLATWAATPGAFIFFGILHQIALASLLGLAFLRLPAAALIAIAAATIALPFFYTSNLFNHPALWWVGLSSERLRSNDYVPLFPWFGAVLAGMAAAKLAQAYHALDRLRARALPRPARLLSFLGRHSLAVYLIHQPVLIGLLWFASQVAPPAPIAAADRFTPACERSCGQSRGEEFCSLYCACMLDELTANKTLDSVLTSTQTGEDKAALEETIGMCTAQTEDTMAGEGSQ